MQTELAASIKDRAENLMIVDLLRNDMSRVASKGTVRVRDLFKIEKYPTVLQMTSGVFCTPKEGTRLVDVLKALFPCGSITGAPKLSAMKAISLLEMSPRGPYCGMIIHIGPGPTGDISASVPIRTVVISREPIVSTSSSSDDGSSKRSHTFDTAPRGCTAEYGVGGGITWDSTANGEFDEVLSKAAVLFAASSKGGNIKDEEIGKKKNDDLFSLFETLRFCANSATYLYKALHIQRLKDSCEYFGFQFDVEKAEALLDEFQINKTKEESSEI
jgi:para-aminobenzoate synthetase/4-amino-4-deoxychorismate lyase